MTEQEEEDEERSDHFPWPVLKSLAQFLHSLKISSLFLSSFRLYVQRILLICQLFQRTKHCSSLYQSIKGSNHQWSRGLVWNRAELLHPVRYIYIWATAGESSSLPVFSCVLSLCLLCCITSIWWGFWTGQLPVWSLGLKISLDNHNLLVDSVCLDLLGSFNVWTWHLTSFNYEYEAG